MPMRLLCLFPGSSPAACGRAALLLAVAVAVGPAVGDDAGVTVTAAGEVEAPPDRVRLAVVISGEAEMAGDAVTKYETQRTRFTEAAEALAIEGLTLTGRPPSVSQQASVAANPNQRVVVNGVVQAATGSAGGFTVSEQMDVELPAGENLIASVSRLYDLGRDLGVTFASPASASSKGGGTLLQARYDDPAAAEGEASAAAMDQARAKAAKLAELAGRTLGEVLSVATVDSSEEPATGTVRVELRVRFALQ